MAARGGRSGIAGAGLQHSSSKIEDANTVFLRSLVFRERKRERNAPLFLNDDFSFSATLLEFQKDDLRFFWGGYRGFVRFCSNLGTVVNFES